MKLVSVSSDRKLADRSFLPSQMEYERQVASLKAANAAEDDFSVSQAEVSSRQAMLENASDIKVRSEGGFYPPARPGNRPFSPLPEWLWHQGMGLSTDRKAGKF